MALTPAEKQRRYRERRRKDKENEEGNKKKDRERYHKNKKLINDMSERKKRAQRKSWRKAERKERAKSHADNEVRSPEITSHVIINNEQLNKIRGRKNIRRDRCKLYKENLKLKAELKKLKTSNEKYRKNAYRSKTKNEENDMTPKSKTNKIMRELSDVTPEGVKKVRRLLFKYHCLSESLKEKYILEKKKKVKNTLKAVVASKIIKKYKMMQEIGFDCLGLSGRTRIPKMPVKIMSKKIRAIQNFYHRDDVSRASAGKKETATKNKQKIQKRYLLDTMLSLHHKFKKEVMNVSYATFTRHRPFYVVSPSVGNRETCLCLIHSNMKSRVSALKTNGVCETKDLDVIIKDSVCDLKSKKCMYNECEICKKKRLHFKNIPDQEIEWAEWIRKEHEYDKKSVDGNEKVKTKKIVKEKIRGNVSLLVEKFTAGIERFKKHIFNIKQQYHAYRTCIDTLLPNEAAIHIDFSENYNCKLAEEVQGHHFGASRNQISLHTCVLYIKTNEDLHHESLCTVSSSNEHGPSAIWAHLLPIIEHIKTKYKNVDTLHIFSDGPCTQYRQKKNFYLFNQKIFEHGFKYATWSYFESGHGKGAADGVGGALKRIDDRIVANGNDIKDETDFHRLVKPETNIILFLVSQNKINSVKSSLPEGIPVMPGTMKMHQLILIKPGVIHYRDVSCYCSTSIKGQCECFETSIYLIKEEKAKSTEAGPSSSTKLRYIDIYTSSEDETSKSSDDEDYEKCALADDPAKKIIFKEFEKMNIQNGTYLLVELLGGRKMSLKYRYLAIAESGVEDNDIKVTYLKSLDNSKKKFKIQENDTSYICYSQILGIIKTPTIKLNGGRVYYEFDCSVDVNEKL